MRNGRDSENAQIYIRIHQPKVQGLTPWETRSMTSLALSSGVLVRLT